MKDYITIKPSENCGMCGYIWQTIRAIHHNPDRKYYVDFSNSIYKADKENIWDCFFKQPHSDIPPSPDLVEKTVGIIFHQDSEFVTANIVPQTAEEVQRRRNMFYEIIQKYIRLNDKTQAKVDGFADTHFSGKRVLGVHFRGTDHPDKSRMCNYMQTVKEMLINYDALFVCSDEHERFRMAECAFGGKVVSWESTRSKSPNLPLHSHSADLRYFRNNTKEYQHKIAEDVIIEAYLLSKTNFILCCPPSNVSYLARAINPSVGAIEMQ